MAKQYVSPEVEIVEVDANDGNRYSLPYGIAKGLGLDTTGMRPREVWEMLKGRGITPQNEYDKLKEKAEKELPKEEPEVVDSLYREEQKEKIQRFRNEHQKKTHEFGLVLDENGNTLVYREGKTGSVSFYASEYKNFKGASIIHNHPQANTFLSPADIQMFMETNLRSIEAIGFDGWVHSIELMPKENSQMIFGMEKRVVDFLNAYNVALAQGRKKAKEAWNKEPKIRVKTGKYYIEAPEGWSLYRKGASPRDYMNYAQYANIIQKELIEFSKTSEEKFGIKSVFRKGG